MPFSTNFLSVSSAAVAMALLGLSGGVQAAPACNSAGLVASTYFAGYHANRGFPLSDMQWSKYTDAKYSFAETGPDGTLNISASAPEQIPAFVAAAKQNGVKALISIGGWTGSRYFSTSIGSAENRTAFVKTCLDLVAEHSLDGLDFDWEYPNRQGLGCNAINPDDTANFLSFLQELRAQPEGKDLLLTAAASLYPWYNSTGASSTDLGGFAKVLDYIMVMGYDIYGAWVATAGPNAPLTLACDSRNNQGGISEGVAKWLAAGFPAKQVVLALAAYGHGFSVNQTSAFSEPGGSLNAYPPQNSSHRFQGSSWDTDPPIDPCGNPQPPSGTYQFWSLIKEAGFLDTSGNPQAGIDYGFDNCSMTPFVYNKTSEVWVSYDNTASFAAKGRYILNTGLGGFGLWEAGGDYNNILVDSIRSTLRLK